jgi:hypothetical protein
MLESIRRGKPANKERKMNFLSKKKTLTGLARTCG